MVFLIFAIICSSAIPVLFKALGRWGLDVRVVVTCNYLICAICGALLAGHTYWWPAESRIFMLGLAVVQGGFLAGNLFLLAYTSQTVSVALAAFSSRVAVAVPTAAAFFLFGDHLSAAKMAGIGLALVALYIVTVTKATEQRPIGRRFLLPIVFVSYGLHFLFFKYVQAHYLTDHTFHVYLGQSFLFAFLLSLGPLFLGSRETKSSGTAQRRRAFGWGLLLGANNYLAIYLFIKTLSLPGWESSVIFPSFSFGVVLLSSVSAVILFHERLNRIQLSGLAVGLLSVVLLNS